MKTLLKLAMGVAIAGALTKLLSKQMSGKRADAQGPLPAADASISEGPVESLNDSAGTPASASLVTKGRLADGL
jgi:hypothetical protein